MKNVHRGHSPTHVGAHWALRWLNGFSAHETHWFKAPVGSMNREQAVVTGRHSKTVPLGATLGVLAICVHTV